MRRTQLFREFALLNEVKQGKRSAPDAPIGRAEDGKRRR
jgi:hypothetical protein